MKLQSFLILAGIIFIISLGTAYTTLAQLPPTPTLEPLQPSPTSGSIYLRPTPTLIIIPTGSGTINFDPNNTGGVIADDAIGYYRALNINHIFDFGGYIIVGYFILRYLVRNIGDSTSRIK